MPDDPHSDGHWISDAVARFEGPLVRYACRTTGDLELARDVVQEVFLRLCRQRRADVDGHLAQWLYTVCRRRALDVIKKESRMKVSTNGRAAEDLPDRAALEAAARQAATSRVLALLDRLPPNQEEVVRLKFQAGLSYREISNVTQLSAKNVGYLLHTAVQTLRRQLVPAGGLASDEG